MRGRFLTAVALAFCVAGAAEVPPPGIKSPPVLVLMRKDQQTPAPKTDGTQGILLPLIGAWATASVNKNSARKVEKFNATLAPAKLPAQAEGAFRCFATTRACTEGPVFTDDVAFSQAVRASPAKEGFVVQLLPELIPEQLLIRAYAHRAYVADDAAHALVHEEAGYFALYTTRMPEVPKKAKPAELEQYWSQGEPRRIEEASRRGLAEINALFAMQLRDEGLSDPTPTLVSAKDFPDKKRLACKSGPVCAMTYVFKDNGDSFVLVFGTNYAGWFDAAAAAHQAGLPGMVTYGAN